LISVSLNSEIHLLFLTLLSDKVPAAAEPLPQRKRPVLQPRSVPVELASPVAESESSPSEGEASNIDMTEEAALKQISEDLKEFFAVRNLEEAEVYFSSLPPQHHHLLVDKIVSTAVESKEDDAKLVSQFFVLAVSKELCSAASFEDGLTPVAEIIDDIAIDAPKAFQLLATMIKGAGLDQERLSNLASKSLDSVKFLALLQ
jgi:translation initiation factor 4G